MKRERTMSNHGLEVFKLIGTEDKPLHCSMCRCISFTKIDMMYVCYFCGKAKFSENVVEGE